MPLLATGDEASEAGGAGDQSFVRAHAKYVCSNVAVGHHDLLEHAAFVKERAGDRD